MALSRRTGTRFQASIWPGFVDAMTGLLLVLMFVLTIFMVVQFVLRETISGQETKLDALSAEVAALAEALGLEQDRSALLDARVGELTTTLGNARANQAEQAARIASFEEQVAGLLAERASAFGQISDLEEQRDSLLSEQEALQLALTGLRDEIDAQAEAARLAAARRAALDALVADLRDRSSERSDAEAALSGRIAEVEEQLTEAEQARLLEAAAAEALRERLENAESELTAMTLALEEQRQNAEDTLAMLAAVQLVRDDLNAKLAEALVAQQAGDAQTLGADEIREELAAALAAKLAAETEAIAQLSKAEERAALLAQAKADLSGQQEIATEAQRQQALLNRQVAALRDQLLGLQALLDDAKAREAAADIQLQSLGKDLNTALARVAAEERRRRELEQEKLKLLEAEKQDLERYRSEFFGRLRDVLGAQEGVRIVGDRFVFSSEVLFEPGQARLSPEGRDEITKVTDILDKVSGDIPESIEWILQVDGHTDDAPIVGHPDYADNWELSQARALSVVRYMVEVLGMPPRRLSANGFGQFQPVNPANSYEARAQNRRIELKFTEK